MSEESKYSATNSQIGAMGDHAVAHDFTQQIGSQEQSPIDLTELAEQLGKIIAVANSRATEPEHQMEIGAISAAKKAAEAGDESKALTFLKSAGKWTLGIATDLSAKIVAELISKMLKPI